jgi:hypothetical protein
MVPIYGEALSNTEAARRLCMDRFPDRQVPFRECCPVYRGLWYF